MEGEMRLNRNVLVMGLLALVMGTALVLVNPAPADGSIHEIIGALCREGGEEVVPPGQNRGGRSLLSALQATGVIESIEQTPTAVIIHFNPDVPPSKFIATDGDLVIEDEIAPGVDLILSPNIIPNPDFPAHANCRNLNP
jgi:hypothetical protein